MTKKNYEELVYKREKITYELSSLEGKMMAFDCYKEGINYNMKVEILLAAVFLLFAIGLMVGGCIGIKIGYEAMIFLLFASIIPGIFSWNLSMEAAKDHFRLQQANEGIEETKERHEALQRMYEDVDQKIKEADEKNATKKPRKTTNK